jgi:hypothetical protein
VMGLMKTGMEECGRNSTFHSAATRKSSAF